MSTHRRASREDPLFLHAYGPGFTVVGQVTRLGARRVVYEYIDFGEDHPDQVTVHLFSSNDGLQLMGIPCVLVEDKLMTSESPLTSLIVRRCELELRHLTADQEKVLLEFLKSEYLSKVKDMTHRRETVSKPQVGREIGHIKARGFFSLMDRGEQAV